MERFKGSIRVHPRRFFGSIDNERSGYHHDSTYNQHGKPNGIVTCRNLTGRNKTQYEGKQWTAKTKAADKPHQTVATLTDTERTTGFLHPITQCDCTREHQHIHNQVKDNCQLWQNLIETLYGRHNHEQQAQECNSQALNQQDIFLHTQLICFLEERRQITGFANGKDTFWRTGHPCQYACQHAESQCNCDNRRQPRSINKLEIVVKTDQQTLSQVNVLLRDNDT